MFNTIDVQITKCFFLEGTTATRSCVSTMLCFSVDAVQQKGWTATKKDKKNPNSFFFLFSNLYIKCNVRSYQYSTFVSVFHLWVPSGVRGGDANVGCCRFIFYLNIKLIHRSAIFNLAGGKVADVQTFIFLCWVMTVSYWSCYVTLWGCSPATVAELWDASKMNEAEQKKGLARVFLRCVPRHWNSCTD